MVSETPLSVYADCAASLSSLRDNGPVICQGQHWRQLNPVDTRKHWIFPEIPLDSPPRRAVFPSESKGKFISSLFLSVVLSLLRPQLRSRMRDQSRPRVKFFQATELNVMKKTQQSLIPSRLIPALFFFF